MAKQLLYLGPFVHSISLSTLEYCKFGAILTDTNGKIVRVERCQSSNEEKFASDLIESQKGTQVHIVKAKKHQFLIPGFIDTHTHAPQTVNAGLGLDLPLLEWLETYTFPREAKFKDLRFADLVYPTAVAKHVGYGTTTCCYYATIHLDATKRLVDIVETIGQRAFIGKVNMDRNSPEFLIEETQNSLKDTREFVEYVQKKDNPLIKAVITPRFAPSCTPELLESLGTMAKEFNLPIQSHIGENLNEIKWVSELFPESKSYAGVYETFNLLNEKTIMAHCIYMKQDELELFQRYRVGVSHCASSNFGLSSGVCPVRKLLDCGIKVGLGTDVSGGYSSSMLDAIRQTILASKVINIQDRNIPCLSIAEGFYLGTMGSAQVCGIDSIVGNFEVGKEFDSVLVSLDQFYETQGLERPEDVELSHYLLALNKSEQLMKSNVDLWDHDRLETMFERFIYLGDDRNVDKVWVKGNLIKQ